MIPSLCLRLSAVTLSQKRRENLWTMSPKRFKLLYHWGYLVATKFKLRSNLSSCCPLTQGAFSKLPCLSQWERVAEGRVRGPWPIEPSEVARYPELTGTMISLKAAFVYRIRWLRRCLGSGDSPGLQNQCVLAFCWDGWVRFPHASANPQRLAVENTAWQKAATKNNREDAKDAKKTTKTQRHQENRNRDEKA